MPPSGRFLPTFAPHWAPSGLLGTALLAFGELTRTEGIIPALESSHAVAYAKQLAEGMTANDVVLVNLSGRGDKDMETVAAHEGVSL